MIMQFESGSFCRIRTLMFKNLEGVSRYLNDHLYVFRLNVPDFPLSLCQ